MLINFIYRNMAMKSNLQKMEILQEKINQLKAEQNKIEQNLINDYFQVLKSKEAFQIDFDSMVGGLLATIETIRADPRKEEEWRLIGQKFCKSKITIMHGKRKQVEPKLERHYDRN